MGPFGAGTSTGSASGGVRSGPPVTNDAALNAALAAATAQPTQLVGDAPQPRHNPNEIPRFTNTPIDIAGNFFRDIGDIGQGLGVMGSIAGARVLETAMGQSPIRADDGQQLMKFAGGVVDFYNQTYLQPILKGRPQDILDFAAQHPLNFLLDASAVGGGALVGKASSRLAATAAGQKATAAASKLPGVARGHLQRIAAGESAIAGGARALDAVIEKAAIEGAISSEIDKVTTPIRNQIQTAWEQVPASEKGIMVDVATGAHPRLLEEGTSFLSAEGQAFLEVIRPVSAKATALLRDMQRVGAEEVLTRRMAPAVNAMRNVFGLESADIANLMKSNPEQFRKLALEARARLNAVGVDPIIVPRVTAKQAKKINANPLKPAGFTTRVSAERARAVADKVAGMDFTKDVKNATLSARERAIINPARSERFSKNAAAASLAGFTEVAQLTSTYKVLLNRILANGVEDAAKAAPGSVAFRPREFLLKIGKMPKFSEKELALVLNESLPEVVYIPQQMVKALERIGGTKPSQLSRLYNGFANIARRYVLGFNFTLPEFQAVQNEAMLMMTQFTGPIDSILTFASYRLAVHPEVAKIVPRELVTELTLGEALAPPAADALGKAGQAIERVIDFNFSRLGFYDKYSRMRAASHYALRLSAKHPELGGPINGMITTGEAINRVRDVFANPEMAEQVARQVRTTLGDYSALHSKNRALLRSTFLWWNWYEHIVRFAVSLPATNPAKTAILVEAAEVATEMFQGANLPEGLAKAGAVQLNPGGINPLTSAENPDGVPLFVIKSGLNPFVTVSELMEFVQQPIEGTKQSTVIGAMNPIFPFLFAQITKRNPQTGRNFRDPRLISSGGRQFKQEDVEAGRFIEQHPSPNPIEHALRLFSPSPVRAGERVFANVATGGEPSQFTSLVSGEAAPRTQFGRRGEPLKSVSLGQILIESALSVRAFPIDTSATPRIARAQRRALKRARRAGRRQLKGRIVKSR